MNKDNYYIIKNLKHERVTHLISKYLGNPYSNVPAAVLEQAAQLGTEIHQLIEADLDKLDAELLDPLINKSSLHKKLFTQWKVYKENYKEELESRTIYREYTLSDRTHLVAGTADLIVDIESHLLIFDFKTRSLTKEPEIKDFINELVQLAFYYRLFLVQKNRTTELYKKVTLCLTILNKRGDKAQEIRIERESWLFSKLLDIVNEILFINQKLKRFKWEVQNGKYKR